MDIIQPFSALTKILKTLRFMRNMLIETPRFFNSEIPWGSAQTMTSTIALISAAAPSSMASGSRETPHR
jgi:hypothetical protein